MKEVIIGNIASGKTTLARSRGVPVFHADDVAWSGGARVGAPSMFADFERWCEGRTSWVVEGCYGEFAAMVLAAHPDAELTFLDVDVAECLRRFDARGHEPHKFPSREAMLEAYPSVRSDCESYETSESDMGRGSHVRLAALHRANRGGRPLGNGGPRSPFLRCTGVPMDQSKDKDDTPSSIPTSAISPPRNRARRKV